MAKNTASKPYDGQNYETHLVGLWIHNEEPTYLACKRMVRLARKNRYELADMLKDYFEDQRPELEGFWADLLGAALQSVDWVDLAKDLLAE